MEQPVEGGYHWQSPGHVADWLARLPELEPERAAAFTAIVGLLPFGPEEAFSFLDLGAGAGALSAAILSRYSRAGATLADFSQPMMDAGKKALEPFGERYQYVVFDMNAQPWPEELSGPFQAVVSSQAIHHLPNARKAWLFEQVYEHLTPGGVFVNWDPLRHEERQVHDPHDRTLASIEEARDMLQAAGFRDLAVAQQAGDSAVISGRK
ncbi:MAG TPA: methyltransferase domain-containing protein [Chloroflexota bacterium]